MKFGTEDVAQDFYETAWHMANECLEAEKYSDAMEFLYEALETKQGKRNGLVYYKLALCYEKMGETEAALLCNYMAIKRLKLLSALDHPIYQKDQEIDKNKVVKMAEKHIAECRVNIQNLSYKKRN